MINPKFNRFLAAMLAAVLFLLDVPMVHAEPETGGIHESLPLTGLTEGATNTSGENAGEVTLVLDKTSTITLTGDTYVKSLVNTDASNSNINLNGYKLYVDGTAL